MATSDTCCSPAPYFKVHEGKLAAFKALADKMVGTAKGEAGCLYCGFGYDGDQAYCREGYKDVDAWLAHLGLVGETFGEILKVSDITRLEVHVAAGDVAKVQKTLGDMGMKAQVFAFEGGFRH